MNTKSPIPFTDNFDHLQAFTGWLKTRLSRLAAERRTAELAAYDVTGQARTVGAKPVVAVEEVERRLNELKTAEEQADKTFKTRLEAHRKDPNAAVLGIDKAAEEFNLDEAERMILMACAIPAIGETYAEDAFIDAMPSFYGGLTVEILINVLEPESLKQRMEFRKYFRGDAPLVKHGLVTVDHVSRFKIPADFPAAVVSITSKGLSAVTGIDGLDAREGDAE